MNCLHCGRSLIRFAVSVDTADGPVGWGPKCARTVFKIQARRRRVELFSRPPQREVDPRQLDWIGEAQA